MAGSCDRAPVKGDRRFDDPAWRGNPLLRRTMQAYLAASEAAQTLLDDAQLDWRDRTRMQFVLDNLVEGLAPSNNPLLSPLAWKALIDTGVKRLTTDDGERSVLSDVILGREMPYPVSAVQESYFTSPLSAAQRQTVRMWIARGANTPICGGCAVGVLPAATP